MKWVQVVHSARNPTSVRARRPQARPASRRPSARLVKFGMDAETVAAMGDEDVRVLVQRPAVVKKLVAKKAAK